MSHLRNPAFIAGLLLLAGAPVNAEELVSLESVNAATYDPSAKQEAGEISPLIVKTQILLDRQHVSPGVIDGRFGENVSKALGSFEQARQLDIDGKLDESVWRALDGDASRDVLKRYRITEEDLKGPFLGTIPDDYEKMSEMESLAYRTPAEMFAERFHMDIDLLTRLNPDIETATAGTEIVVASVGPRAESKVTAIKVDKQRGALDGFDASGRIVVSYPATIGSSDLPSPSGTHEIKAIAPEAKYYYDPDKNFEADGIKKELTLPAGPNNPIGTTWIDLNKPTYGIHGTPEPAEIDKEASHGCVRLTNWDVEELAELVEPGVEVRFIE